MLYYPIVRELHGLKDDDIQRFLGFLSVGSEHVRVLSYHIGPPVGLDPTDDMVLLTATAKADVLGTNNNHFYERDVQRCAAHRRIRILRDMDLIMELRR